MWWRENILNQRKKHQILIITNRLHEALILAGWIHTKWQKHKVLCESLPFLLLIILASFLLHTEFLFKGGSIYDEEVLRYFFKTKVQGGWHLTFCLKDQNAASLNRSRFKYGVRILTNQNVHTYCYIKNVFLMSERNFEPQPLTWLYMWIFLLRYCTNANMLHSWRHWVTEDWHLQYVLESVLHIGARLRKNKSEVRTEMTSCEL